MFDCFIFSEERLLLGSRLEYLYDSVDTFVIVEGALTFQGEPREYAFPQIINNLTDYREKIVYVQVDDFSETDAWGRESHLRNAISRGLASARGDDIVIVSDVDEIPRKEVVEELRRSGLDGAVALDMRFSYYSVNVCSEKWPLARAVPYRCYAGAQDLREKQNLPLVPNAGWHLSYLGTAKEIQLKLKSFSHTEYSVPLWTSTRHIERCMRLGVRIFGGQRFRIVDESDTYPGLPRELHPNLYQSPLSRLELIYSHLYLLATNHRTSIPIWMSDYLPFAAIMMAAVLHFPLSLARLSRRALRAARATWVRTRRSQ